MTAIQLKLSYLKSLKRQLREQCDATSAHLSKAIARGCGYRTNAAFRADLNDDVDGEYIRFDQEAFRERLQEFGASAPDELFLPELGRSARYFERLFDDPAVEILALHPMHARFRLAGIPTVVTIGLHHLDNGYTQFRRSHAIHTPTQIGPYYPGRDFDDEPAYAMHRAIESLVDYYREAVRKGHAPDSAWLVPSRH